MYLTHRNKHRKTSVADCSASGGNINTWKAQLNSGSMKDILNMTMSVHCHIQPDDIGCQYYTVYHLPSLFPCTCYEWEKTLRPR